MNELNVYYYLTNNDVVDFYCIKANVIVSEPLYIIAFNIKGLLIKK